MSRKPISRAQIIALQAERRKYAERARQQGSEFGEEQWRMVLRDPRIGAVTPDATGHVSVKALDNAGFDRVRAFLRQVPVDDCSRLRYEIAERYAAYAAGRSKPVELDGIIFQAARRSVQALTELDRAECVKVIEAIKAIVARGEK